MEIGGSYPHHMSLDLLGIQLYQLGSVSLVFEATTDHPIIKIHLVQSQKVLLILLDYLITHPVLPIIQSFPRPFGPSGEGGGSCDPPSLLGYPGPPGPGDGCPP